MKNGLILVFSFVLSLVFLSCADNSAGKADALLRESRTLAGSGSLNSARVLLDSLHNSYPKCVEQRRLAKALDDSIVYVESQRNLAYADSLLEVLIPRSDSLLKSFRYEKNERYENDGRYVHRLLRTDANTSRCFLQAYTTDARKTLLKSYYCGSTRLAVRNVTLSVGGEQCEKSGADHTFEADGWHSVMTLEDDDALEMLNFISSHVGDRLRVKLADSATDGREKTAVFYLNDQEKQALQDTYHLGLLMRDIRQVEDIQRVSRAKIEKYERKYML